MQTVLQIVLYMFTLAAVIGADRDKDQAASGTCLGTDRPTIVVASQAAMKVGAVQKIMKEKCFGDPNGIVEGVKAPSGIGEQPFGHDETIRGAMNRLNSAKSMKAADFYVSIENGIFEVEITQRRYFDVAWVVIEKAGGKQSLAHSVGVEMPAEYVEKALAEGFDKTNAGTKLAAENPGVNKQDPHKWLLSGQADREELLIGALKAACGQLKKATV